VADFLSTHGQGQLNRSAIVFRAAAAGESVLYQSVDHTHSAWVRQTESPAQTIDRQTRMVADQGDRCRWYRPLYLTLCGLEQLVSHSKREGTD